MSASLKFEGLAELRAALRAMPATLRDEGLPIVKATAEGATAEMVAEYETHDVTGNLSGHVINTAVSGDSYGARYVVKNTAKHAWIFENGTQARHTALGLNRGAMPPGRVFIPIIERWRRRMYAQLKALLETHGLKVTGDA